MKRHFKLYAIIMLIIILTLSACKKTMVNYSNEDNIDEENLLAIVKELSSEKYKGRLVGTKENELATQYIADKFKEIGLENPQGLDNYLQDFITQIMIIDEEPTMQIEDKDGNVIRSFKYAENFLYSAFSDSDDLDIKAPLYYVDNHEDTPYVNKGAKDKISLFPASKKKYNSWKYDGLIRSSGSLTGISEVDIKSSKREHSNLTVRPMGGGWLNEQILPYLEVDSDTFKELKDATEKELFLHIKYNFTVERNKKVSNVIGIIPGSDSKLKDEYIIIGAHFDHVGDNKNGTYNSGSLDNASGTAGLLEIARIIKSSKILPQKTIIFIAFNGEEIGMTGSEHYVENPIYPLERSVMINLDMIGCSSDVPISIWTVKGAENKLQEQLIKHAKELKIKCIKATAGSDHSSFSEKGVEAVCFINEDWSNGYHSYNDTIEDVDKFKMEQIVKLVLFYIENSSSNSKLKVK